MKIEAHTQKASIHNIVFELPPQAPEYFDPKREIKAETFQLMRDAIVEGPNTEAEDLVVLSAALTVLDATRYNVLAYHKRRFLDHISLYDRLPSLCVVAGPRTLEEMRKPDFLRNILYVSNRVGQRAGIHTAHRLCGSSDKLSPTIALPTWEETRDKLERYADFDIVLFSHLFYPSELKIFRQTYDWRKAKNELKARETTLPSRHHQVRRFAIDAARHTLLCAESVRWENDWLKVMMSPDFSENKQIPLPILRTF